MTGGAGCADGANKRTPGAQAGLAVDVLGLIIGVVVLALTDLQARHGEGDAQADELRVQPLGHGSSPHRSTGTQPRPANTVRRADP